MNQRDVELLSSYLDGELKPSDSARLEARFNSEPELVSVLDDLRGARSLLRRLPQRRAPRNFTLTRKMVGQNPPLPRSYPLFRFATALATLLFFFTFGLNFTARQLAAAPLTGRGGADTSLYAQEEPAAAEAPATEAPATEAPLEAPAATEPPAATSAPPELAPLPTQQLPSGAAAPTEESQAEKNGAAADSAAAQPPPVQESAPLIPSTWQVALAVLAILGALFMVLLRRSASNRWR